MATLHGSWISQTENRNGYFFIWGETWRPYTSQPSNAQLPLSHPFALTQEELVNLLDSHQLVLDKILPSDERWHSQAITLPSQEGAKDSPALPLLSGQIEGNMPKSLNLQTWQVQGFSLSPLEATQLLQRLPLSSLQTQDTFVGSDLSYWAQIYRWSLDLLARSKFLPNLDFKGDNGSSRAYWQPLLDSAIDQARFSKFTSQMPDVCRAYLESDSGNHEISEWIEAPVLLLNFLSHILDAQLRSWATVNPTISKVSLVFPWLEGLSQEAAKFEIEDEAAKRLETALENWTVPIQESLGQQLLERLGKNQFRLAFRLQPPTEGELNWGRTNWKLQYGLQAFENSNCWIEAETIWQHPVNEWVYEGYTLTNPQEMFLKGLGVAARIYDVIQDSLNTPQPTQAELDPIQVYQFIRSIAGQLEDNGMGVILPPGLAKGETEKRLGLKIKAQLPKKNERLGLQSLLKFKLELAVGDKSLSKAEFERLLDQKSPLVQVGDEWIALQPADVRAAQAVLASSDKEMSLSVEDAVRLSAGENKTIAKLPVVNFEASGALQELIQNLTDNRSIEPIETPKEFKGELRPYQARGAGWLTFLERWGLGACLADDMGLGKCLAPDSQLFVNGTLQTAETIWQSQCGDVEFDGEGFWKNPHETLWVNGIHNQTGKIIPSPIKRLYRQQVQEKMRRITLQDGNTITITQRHKLLTNQGWTNELNVGDFVCVPAKLVWQGKTEDPDLVKFLAWQIAEGYEILETAFLSICQKDTDVLEDLWQTLYRLSEKYSIKINSPRVKKYPNRCSNLSLTSRDYQRFLESHGYSWGKRSAEKSIPSWILQADLETVKIFLSHYFDAEASVIDSMRSIEIATASPQIIQQLSVLLRRFGIWLRITPKQKCATNGSRILRTYYIGTIGGNSARRFYQRIGFNTSEKQHKLAKICDFNSNTNVEGIPASKIVAETVTQTRLPIQRLGMHNTVYINGSQQFSRASLERVIGSMERVLAGVAEEEYRQQKASRWTNQTLEAYRQLDDVQLSLTQQKLQQLLEQEVFYCPIEEIEEVEYEGWVYDFEVSEHHNFVANNILCHNTIQTLAFLLKLREEKRLKSATLLVCPTSVLGNWEREVKRFAPTLSTLVHHGDKRSKGKDFAKEVKNKDLVITSYPLVYRDEKTLQGIEWEGIVLDEAQNIKNPQGKQSKAVRNLKAEFRIALTGTPVENRLSELWSILDFLNPGYLGNQQFFQRRFAMPIEKYGDRNSLLTLRSLVQPFILRRLKTDKNIIQDLPEKQEMNVFCGLSEEQANLYQSLVDASLEEIEEAEGIQRHGKILTLILRLKQVCNHPALYQKEKSMDSAQRSGKLLRLQEMVEELVSEGDRALIFTQFSEWGKLLQPYLAKKLNEEVLFIYGGTKRNQREEIIDRFQNDPNAPHILILSLKAGGTGLNLTRANHVFHVDRWWNPAVENQATDRAFRIGQKQNVQVHKFVCNGTLEERINDIIESKKELAEQTVDAGEQWLTQMDTDQLRSLLLLDRNAVIDE